MISFTVFVAFIGLVNIRISVVGDSCTTFTTSTVVSEESATLRFSLPESCTRDNQLNLVSVSAKKSTDKPPDDVCQISSSYWLKKSEHPCILDVKAKEYTVTRKFGPTVTQEEVILTAVFEGADPIQTSVFLHSPITTEGQSTWIPTPVAVETTRSITARPRPSGNSGSTVKIEYKTDSPKKDVDTQEEEEATPATKPSEDIVSFTQTPAYGFVLMGTIMGVILLLVAFLLKTRARWLPVVRRMRNSMATPDNYERPTDVAHPYELPIFRSQIPLPAPPPRVIRESVIDPNYDVIDDLNFVPPPVKSTGYSFPL